MFRIGFVTAPQFENGRHGSPGTLLHRNVELVRLVHFEMQHAEPHLYFRPWRTLIPHLNNDQHLLQEIVRVEYEKFPAGQGVYWELNPDKTTQAINLCGSSGLYAYGDA
jgi:hypothetical protein